MTPEYTEGVCGDGAAILRDGERLTISEVLDLLNRGDAVTEGHCRRHGETPAMTASSRDFWEAAAVKAVTTSMRLREALFRLKTECEIDGLDARPGFDCWIALANEVLADR